MEINSKALCKMLAATGDTQIRDENDKDMLFPATRRQIHRH